jgi:hypothetical protein
VEKFNEVLEGIELPKELQRDKVEGFLKEYNDHLKTKEVVNL